MGLIEKHLTIPKRYEIEAIKTVTPAYLFDAESMDLQYRYIKSVTAKSDCKLLFPLKVNSIPVCLEEIKNNVSGFATSSLFEAKLARDILREAGEVHFISPGIRPSEITELARLCDFITLNSFTQLDNYAGIIDTQCRFGLRINPEISFVTDDRYNPCGPNSKLGVPISNIKELALEETKLINKVSGILVHNNCESEDFTQLLKTVEHLISEIPGILDKSDWINLGGGYLFDHTTDWTKFSKSLNLLTDKFDLEVYFEPGRGIIGEAGYIITSVIDLYKVNGTNIAVLDTSVNHMPEVFEYQYKPLIMQSSDSGEYEYLLAGLTCLAGDVFGKYMFDEPLEIGSRLVFEDMGAYSLVKANMFNGVNLPSIYIRYPSGEFHLVRDFDHNDFLNRCGKEKHGPA